MCQYSLWCQGNIHAWQGITKVLKMESHKVPYPNTGILRGKSTRSGSISVTKPQWVNDFICCESHQICCEPGKTNHWIRIVIIFMKFSSLAAPDVVKMTTSGAASDENFIKMTFPFQCRHWNNALKMKQYSFPSLALTCVTTTHKTSTKWRDLPGFHAAPLPSSAAVPLVAMGGQVSWPLVTGLLELSCLGLRPGTSEGLE